MLAPIVCSHWDACPGCSRCTSQVWHRLRWSQGLGWRAIFKWDIWCFHFSNLRPQYHQPMTICTREVFATAKNARIIRQLLVQLNPVPDLGQLKVVLLNGAHIATCANIFILDNDAIPNANLITRVRSCRPSKSMVDSFRRSATMLTFWSLHCCLPERWSPRPMSRVRVNIIVIDQIGQVLTFECSCRPEWLWLKFG